MSSSSGERVPHPRQNGHDRGLAARYAPVIRFNRLEPFLPLAAGYTIFHTDADSVSFPRRIELAGDGHPPAAFAIEYAIWWDWDIQHLYELEHAWTYVGKDDHVVFAEASWHGGYSSTVLPDGRVSLAESQTNPVIYSQPGKHAFAPMPEMLQEIADNSAAQCGLDAGTAGLCVTPAFKGALARRKNPEVDALVGAYLKARAFCPSDVWDKEFPITREMLVPWPALFAWVPKRIDWWIARLKAGEV